MFLKSWMWRVARPKICSMAISVSRFHFSNSGDDDVTTCGRFDSAICISSRCFAFSVSITPITLPACIPPVTNLAALSATYRLDDHSSPPITFVISFGKMGIKFQYPAVSRCPRVTSFPARASLTMRVIGRDGDLIHKPRFQPLDGPPRSLVVRVARNGYGIVHRTDKRRQRPARLKCVAVTSMALLNLEPDVPSPDPHMLRIADSKVDVTNIRPADSHNPEMIKRNEAFCRFTRHNPDELE